MSAFILKTSIDEGFSQHPETQCLNAFIQILLNSDLKASMRVENLTQYNYPTAPDKKVQMKLSYRYLPSKHLLF